MIRPDHLMSRDFSSRTFHEPTVRSPGFSRSGPPEGGTPNKWRPHGPVHGPNACEKRNGAFHEPVAHQPTPDPSQEGNWPTGGERAFVRAVSVPLPGGVRGGFMVP